ncbi:MAG: hypothetical protein ACHQF3_00110 [Alphaproteobacteria bacterium]
MIPGFEIASSLDIIDRASPKLERVLGLSRGLAAEWVRIKELGAGLFAGTGVSGFSTQLGRLSPRLSTISEQLGQVRAASAASFAGMDAALASTTEAARVLKVELGEVAAAAGAVRIARPLGLPGGFGGGRTGGGGGGSGFHIGGYAPIGGPFHARFGATPAIGAAALLAWGTYQEAELQQTVSRMMLAAEQPLSADMMSRPIAQAIRKGIQEGAALTGLSPRQLEAAAMPVMLQMGGRPFEERVRMLPDMFRFAAIEGVLKGVAPEEATRSLTGLIHMVGAYDPETMRSVAAKLAFASTISPVGLPGIERAASYVIPSAVQMGLDPGTLLLTLAQAQSAGVLQGKAGTWFGGMLQALAPKGNFASILTGHGARERLAGLQELGLADRAGAPTGLRMLEHNDWAGFLKTVAQRLAQFPREQWMGKVFQAMGSTQAARGLMTLLSPAMLANLPELEREQLAFLSGDAEGKLKELADANPVLRARKALAGFNVVAMDVGQDVLPAATAALSGLDYILKSIGKTGIEVVAGLTIAITAMRTFGGLAGLLGSAGLAGASGQAAAAIGTARGVGLIGSIGALVIAAGSAAFAIYGIARGLNELEKARKEGTLGINLDRLEAKLGYFLGKKYDWSDPWHPKEIVPPKPALRGPLGLPTAGSPDFMARYWKSYSDRQGAALLAADAAKNSPMWAQKAWAGALADKPFLTGPLGATWDPNFVGSLVHGPQADRDRWSRDQSPFLTGGMRDVARGWQEAMRPHDIVAELKAAFAEALKAIGLAEDKQTIHLESKVMLNERELGRAVADIQARDARRPVTGPSSHDPSMSYPSPAAGGVR